MKRLVLFAFLLAGTSAHALLIDDFSDGAYHVTIDKGADIHIQAASSAIGGTRYTNFLVWPSQPLLPYKLSVDPGFFVSSPAGGSVRSALSWGLMVDLHLDLAQKPLLKVDFTSNNEAHDVQVEVYSHGVFKDLSVTVPGGQKTPFTQYINLGALAGSFDLADVQQITLINFGAPGGNFGISSVEAVPDPAQIVVLGLGFVGLVARRRGRR